MTVNTQQIAAVIRQVCAIAAVVVGSLQDANVVPGRYGWILQLVGGALLAVEHYVSDPSTGAVTPPATTAAAPRPAAVATAPAAAITPSVATNA